MCINVYINVYMSVYKNMCMCINVYMFYVYKYVYSHIFSYGSHFTLLANNRLQYMLSISEIWIFSNRH